jgi:hypothetical protein
LLSDLAGRAFFRHDTAELPFVGFGKAARAGRKNSLLRRYTDYRGGVLGDEERLAVVREATQGQGSRGFGVTVVAAWMNEAPSSAAFEEAYRRAIHWVVQHKPDVRNPEELIESLSKLFKSSRAGDEILTPEALQHRVELFSEFYYHAVPFDPEKLLRVGSRCRELSKNREQCISEAPEGSSKAVAIMQRGEGAMEEFIAACMSRMYEGPQCKRGYQAAQALLAGENI